MEAARGLERLLGNQDKYVDLLRRFIHNHEDDPARLGECLETGYVQELRRIAHGLKGAAATLGAMSIAQAASELDATVRAQGLADGADIRVWLRALERDLSALSAALGGAA
jgi:HPt (histidine-containing phosphotransfer) domain-containing protein